MIPNWYALLLLAGAAWRTFQLIGHDDILDRPRRWALRLGRDWQKDGDPVPESYRAKWGVFITCPYCAGFWISLAWFVAWYIEQKWTLVAAIPFVLSALVVAQHKVLAEEED